MKPLVKIPRKLLETAMADLERPHPFAYERLGFFSLRQSFHPQRPVLLCYDYHTIPDEQYMRDDTCAARIGGEAIRIAMGRAIREQCGQLWVHTHGRNGNPFASPTDRAEGPNIVRSLINANNASFQGWAVISEDGITGQVRGRGGNLQELEDLSVVGWPTVVPVRREQNNARQNRYARQSFLGKNSQNVFENTKVGIIGLGGGGSHINQQLAHLGFQNVVLCDADRVEMTNLNRLVGATLQDARKRRFKNHVASRLFKRLQPLAEIDDTPDRWEQKRENLRDCDVIFGCLDSFAARRDLEAFCRSMMIPLIDVGMTVLRPEEAAPDIHGQAIVSMPAELCMHCLQFLTPETLAKEVQDYNAGPQPQVVWSNGILASNAVGYAIALLTGWSGTNLPSCRIDHRGSELTMKASNLVAALKSYPCKHYPLSQIGDPVFKKL